MSATPLLALAAVLLAGLMLRARRDRDAASRAAASARADRDAIERRLDDLAAVLADEADDEATEAEPLCVVRLWPGCGVVLPEGAAVRLALALPGYEGGVGRRLS